MLTEPGMGTFDHHTRHARDQNSSDTLAPQYLDNGFSRLHPADIAQMNRTTTVLVATTRTSTSLNNDILHCNVSVADTSQQRK
jgi:hypothetical protein